MAKGASFLFLGPELGEKEDAIAEIRRNLIKPEETSFYAGETTMNDMVGALRNGSLFADTRLFFIKNADALSAENNKKKADLDLLVSYMESPQEDTTLILISEETKLNPRLEKAVPAAAKRIFWELDESRKAQWVESFFRRQGCKIDPDGIETILEMVENNTGALGRECSRLMLFLGKEKNAGAAEVEQWLSHTREESAFTLFSRIAAGDFSKSLECLHSLLAAKESPQAILAALTWCFKKLRDYAALTEGGAVDEFEYKKIGLASRKIRQDYSAAAARYQSADPCLSLIACYDIKIRSTGTAAETLLMDYFIYELFSLQQVL
ncbi:DNA polymerase III subunit delta [Spirochaetia bacterium]|nr:DNA polymerase III subunit delta [Spirochaetia bacterium]